MSKSQTMDEVYIRKGVELARWTVRNSGQVIEGIDGYFGNISDQSVRDALAAQLVRQVDALGYNVHVGKGITVIYQQKEQMFDPPVITDLRPNSDRTLNTIKTIIDSGVLE